MAYEQKEGQGAMFPNQYKKSGDNKPDLTGNIKINGEVIKIAGWYKEGKNGQFLSVSVDNYKG